MLIVDATSGHHHTLSTDDMKDEECMPGFTKISDMYIHKDIELMTSTL